jgi:acyl-CoA thioester hydrolase
VNNVVYLRWFETARMALFQRLGFTSGTGVGPILHSTSCRYRVPVYAPDDVVAAVRVTDVKADRFALEMSVYSARAGAVAATGDAVIVAYDYEAKRKAAVPAEVLERLRDVVAEGALIPPLAPQR